ncbi:MAG: sigma-70 family RNA polymerase sigma factor [Gemmatimonadaceae bacterium]
MANAPAGDPVTFRQLFDDHAEGLRRYARRFVRSRESAEDLVQDVFLRFWRLGARVQQVANARAYLYASTRTRALDVLAHERREERRRREYAAPDLWPEGPVLPPEGEASAEADDVARAVERVLEALPRRQREVALLRLREQLTTAQIAERLGISPRTVEAHVAQMTRALRQRLPALLGEASRRAAPEDE